MQHRNHHSEITVLEALDNLSYMAELDLSGTVDKDGMTQEQINEQMQFMTWHDPSYNAYNQERAKDTFRVIHKYMQEMYDKDQGQLREENTQRGLFALMQLASEAAQKIDNFTEIFKIGETKESVTELKEFKDLQHFYLTKIIQRFQPKNEKQETWREEWGSGQIPTTSELLDLKAVRGDKEYELFLIRNDAGLPFFNRELIRHLHLVGDFDTVLLEALPGNPLQKVELIQDREAHLTAKEILKLSTAYIDDYFKEAMKFKQMGFVSAINKAIMALMLAANSRNLMQTAQGKSALNYYADFGFYLRDAMSSKEYKRFIANPPADSEKFIHSLLNLSQTLCSAFFLKAINKKDTINLLHTLKEKANQRENAISNPMSFWHRLNDEDQCIREALKSYPNGPMLKVLKLFHQDAELKGFDPISKHNLTGQLYTLSCKDLHVSCIRLPSPTFQEKIAEAKVVDEFTAFLHSLNQSCHLMINLQNRTSWQEHSRTTALEELQKKSEFSSVLKVVTLPTAVDFYLQSGPYQKLDDANEFIHQFLEQLKSSEQCGFYFPEAILLKEIVEFSRAALNTIHEVFFMKKEVLSHKNRLDFIEIFYYLLTFKLIEMFKPGTLSFTCKDGVDTGAAFSAGFFAFARMMNDSSSWTNEEKDFMRWMLYAPGLLVRERAIDHERIQRTLSALTLVFGELQAHSKEIATSCNKLFQLPLLTDLKAKEA